MKNKLILNLALMASAALLPLASLTSCSDSGRGESFKWPHVSEEVDALSYKLDSMYFHRAPVTELESVLDSLRTAAAKCPRSEELSGRLSYFWAIVANRHPGPNSTLDTIIAVSENIDSTKHPYLFNRASQIIDQTLPVSLPTYDKTLARIRYFEEIQDTYLTAEHYMNLGVLLKNVKDYDAALRAFSVADSLFMLSGYRDMATQNMANVSNVYFWLGDSAKSVQLAHRAASDSTIWFNLAIHFDDEAALDSMLSVGFRQHPSRQYSLRAKRSHRHGDYARAVSYADTAIFLAKRKKDLHGLWYAYKAGAPALAHLGRDSQAYDWLNRAMAIRDSVDKIEDHDNVQILETGRQIATRRMEHELERSRRTLVWVCVAFGVFLILVAAAWIVALRMRRLKRQRAEASRERDRVSQELIATKIAMDETQQLISSVGKEIGDMADEGRLPDGETRRIVSVIKSHNTRQSQRESFVDTFGQVHPGFARKLRELNDSITEQDIRIAMYVATGIDSKQIASSIGIRPESVKQARWRLRTKLSLAKGDSLDKYLQDLLLE